MNVAQKYYIIFLVLFDNFCSFLKNYVETFLNFKLRMIRRSRQHHPRNYGYVNITDFLSFLLPSSTKHAEYHRSLIKAPPKNNLPFLTIKILTQRRTQHLVQTLITKKLHTVRLTGSGHAPGLVNSRRHSFFKKFNDQKVPENLTSFRVNWFLYEMQHWAEMGQPISG